jgi:hypothetical protein
MLDIHRNMPFTDQANSSARTEPGSTKDFSLRCDIFHRKTSGDQHSVNAYENYSYTEIERWRDKKTPLKQGCRVFADSWGELTEKSFKARND